MRVPQFSLLSLLIAGGAALIWLFLIVESVKSSGWGNDEIGWLAMRIALIVATGALHRLVRQRRNSWALAASFAGAIIMAAMFAIFAFVDR